MLLKLTLLTLLKFGQIKNCLQSSTDSHKTFVQLVSISYIGCNTLEISTTGVRESRCSSSESYVLMNCFFPVFEALGFETLNAYRRLTPLCHLGCVPHSVLGSTWLGFVPLCCYNRASCQPSTISLRWLSQPLFLFCFSFCNSHHIDLFAFKSTSVKQKSRIKVYFDKSLVFHLCMCVCRERCCV